MSTEQDPSQTKAEPEAPVMSQEFFVRVNDFIQMADRIERRHDTHHAQLAMLHGFARYSAHHYRINSAGKDDAENREAFADYISGAVKQSVIGHLEDMVGPAPLQAAGAAAATAAATTAAATTDGAPGASADPADDAG